MGVQLPRPGKGVSSTQWSGWRLGACFQTKIISANKNTLHFMEPKSSLLHLEVPAICPYPEPDRPISCPHIPLPEDPS